MKGREGPRGRERECEGGIKSKKGREGPRGRESEREGGTKRKGEKEGVEEGESVKNGVEFFHCSEGDEVSALSVDSSSPSGHHGNIPRGKVVAERRRRTIYIAGI